MQITKFKAFIRLILFFPVFLAIVNVVYSHELVYLSYFINGLVVSAVLFLPLLYIRKHPKIYLGVVGLVLYVSTLLNTVHMIIYKSELSLNGIYAVFETNSGEASEFISNYSSVDMTLCLALLTVIPLIYFIRMKIVDYGKTERNRFATLTALFILINLVYGVATGRLIWNMEHHPLVGVVDAVASYYKERKELNEAYSSKIISNISVKRDNSGVIPPDVLVVVVGESLTTKHMGLYGYRRQTNPELSAIRNDLIIYKKAETKYFSTIPSLTAVLSYSQNDMYLPLVDILNKGGFRTDWISNQAALGEWETMLTLIVRDAEYKKYLNNTKGGLQQTQLAIYDEALDRPLQTILGKSKDREIVFMHLIGSHSTYASRYPAAFDYFKNRDKIQPKPWLNEDKKYKKINSYDNSVRYNDHVVSGFIKAIRKTGKSAMLVYFSDHGENVYDDADFAGHSDSAKAECTATVPLIFWASKKYEADNPDMIKYLKERTGESYDIAGLKDMILKISGLNITKK